MVWPTQVACTAASSVGSIVISPYQMFAVTWSPYLTGIVLSYCTTPCHSLASVVVVGAVKYAAYFCCLLFLSSVLLRSRCAVVDNRIKCVIALVVTIAHRKNSLLLFVVTNRPHSVICVYALVVTDSLTCRSCGRHSVGKLSFFLL